MGRTAVQAQDQAAVGLGAQLRRQPGLGQVRGQARGEARGVAVQAQGEGLEEHLAAVLQAAHDRDDLHPVEPQPLVLQGFQDGGVGLLGALVEEGLLGLLVDRGRSRGGGHGLGADRSGHAGHGRRRRTAPAGGEENKTGRGQQEQNSRDRGQISGFDVDAPGPGPGAAALGAELRHPI